jgi:hypothetical protein
MTLEGGNTQTASFSQVRRAAVAYMRKAKGLLSSHVACASFHHMYLAMSMSVIGEWRVQPHIL